MSYQRKANQNNMEQRLNLQRKIDDCTQMLNKAEGCKDLAVMHKERLERLIVSGEDVRRGLLSQYDDVKKRVYPAYEPLHSTG